MLGFVLYVEVWFVLVCGYIFFNRYVEDVGIVYVKYKI